MLPRKMTMGADMRVTTIYLTAGAAILVVTEVAFASGYRIPEQSINATALGSAYVANANYADAAYYNPANMSWMSPGLKMEGGVSYINLPSITYEDFRIPALSGTSENENFPSAKPPARTSFLSFFPSHFRFVRLNPP